MNHGYVEEEPNMRVICLSLSDGKNAIGEVAIYFCPNRDNKGRVVNSGLVCKYVYLKRGFVF